MRRTFGQTVLWLIISLGIVIGVYLTPLLWLFPWTLDRLNKADPLEKAGAAVILEGTYYSRIDHAFMLGEAGYTDVIFYPGPGYETNIEHVRKKIAEHGDTLDCYIGPGAQSTFEEALVTKEFLDNHDITSILLVTSPYHSYRAWWVFKKVLPDIDIIMSTVPYNEKWKQSDIIKTDHRHVRYADKERKKFIASYLFYGWRCFR